MEFFMESFFLVEMSLKVLKKVHNESDTRVAEVQLQSINQSIYLHQDVGWGYPNHPIASQRLMYKTHDKKILS